MAAMSKAQRKRKSRLAKTEREQKMAAGGNSPLADEHRITVLKDNYLIYPELWLEVYVEGNAFEQRMFAEMFSRARCKRSDTPEKADLVIFTGGQDVDPVLYGEERHRLTAISTVRDASDLKLYELCLELGIPMFGVCRGAQFLSVMNGGKLFQDVDGHTGDHGLYDLTSNRVLNVVSSVHHQMVMDNKDGGMEIIAITTNRSTRRIVNNTLTQTGSNRDIEAFFYPDTCCLGVQGHPEYKGYAQFTEWCLKLIETKVVTNPDIDWVGEGKSKKRRIKPELIIKREAARLGKSIDATVEAGKV
jgi:gamma-glutamyl-gamma-aminobutyrate hydrolase PuuD